jgi:hypothetical protein
MVSIVVPIAENGSLQFYQLPLSTTALVIGSIILLAIPLALYLLRSFALYKMAKTENLNNAYFAFIPFLWAYIAGKIAGTPVYFGKPIKKFALIFCIVLTVSEATTLILDALIYVPIIGYALQGGELLYVTEVTSSVVSALNGYTYYPLAVNFFVPNTSYINVPYATYQFIEVLNVISWVLALVDLAVTVLSITMYVGVFKKYWPLHYMSAVIFSVFGLFPIFAFVVRKNKPVDFNQFIRERYARYGAYSNPYANPYNNPYNNPNATQTETPTDPFPEFNNGSNASGSAGTDNPFGTEGFGQDN